MSGIDKISTRGGVHSRQRGSELMAGDGLKILLLAGRLDDDHADWPLLPLLDRLEIRGCDVQVVCISSGPALFADPRVLEVPALASRWLGPFAVRGLHTRDRFEHPDLIHVVHDEMVEVALALSETIRRPYVQTVSHFGTATRGFRVSRRWCRRIVATSLDLAKELISALRVPDDWIAVIRPGLADAPARTAATSEGRVPVIGTGGPREESSGMMVFMDAARIVIDTGRDVEFVIAGQDSQQVVLRHETQRLRIAERVTVADYPSLSGGFWSVLDIYAQPAVAASAGRTLIQAFGHAAPCIASDVQGLRDLIDSGDNGLRVPARDPRALADAMIVLLDHPAEARRMGACALERAHAVFDPDREADRLVDLYRDICSKSPDANDPSGELM